MAQTYIQCHIKGLPNTAYVDLLAAELGTLGFETFETFDSELNAFIPKDLWHENLLHDCNTYQQFSSSLSFEIQEIPPVNWNLDWESNFKPIVVADQCTVRAPFHSPAQTPLEIVINPKMSFGTGHHQTTYMMLAFLLHEDLVNKTVLDMGSGTGVLAILAEMRGANSVTAIDIDPWCYENALENCTLNHCENIRVVEGTADSLGQDRYDLILANINRNILLEDMPRYVACLNPKAFLLISGFYEEDLPLLKQKASSLGLTFVSHQVMDQWVAAKFLFL